MSELTKAAMGGHKLTQHAVTITVCKAAYGFCMDADVLPTVIGDVSILGVAERGKRSSQKHAQAENAMKGEAPTTHNTCVIRRDKLWTTQIDI